MLFSALHLNKLSNYFQQYTLIYYKACDSIISDIYFSMCTVSITSKCTIKLVLVLILICVLSVF